MFSWRPKSLGLILLLYAAALGYALIAWGPALVEGYLRLAASQPWLAYAYLGVVGTGATLLGGASLFVLFRLMRNTAAKNRLRNWRARNPSELSEAERRRELSENLDHGERIAGDQRASAALREQLREQLAALQQKHERQHLEIVAFGTISSGKSSLLNALAGRDAFATDVIGGTTTTRCELPWPGDDRVTLVDTPGLAEVHGERRAAEASEAARNADLVLLVVDGPLKSYEAELAQRLLDMEKRLLVCLNKEDWYEPSEERDLTGQIAEQLPRVAPDDVVAVRAATTYRPRKRVLVGGGEQEELVAEPPDVRPLARRMLAVVRRDGRDLLLANLLLQSRGLVDEAKSKIRSHLDERADEIITRYMWAAGGAAGVNPFPLLDLAGSSALTLKMVIDLARVYGLPLDADLAVKMLEQLSKNLIAMVGATAAAPAVAAVLASLLKTVPGVGTIAGGLLQGLIQALVTRWVGNVFVRYLQNEMQPPPGGLVEVARAEWQKLTTPEALKKLIHAGRQQFSNRDEELR